MKIGYIGLGALGAMLARRFLPAHELVVWDLNPQAVEAMKQEGGEAAATAREVAERSQVVLLCLPRSSDVRQAIFGPAGLAEGLTAGTLVIDQSSGIPAETWAMARELALRGVTLIDAAVSASPHVVAAGGATLMVGGASSQFERALPVLRTITEHVHHCGQNVGEGQAMKMINNAMNAACRLGTLETVAMGRKAGVSLACLTEVLNKGGGRNLTTENMLPALLEGRASTNFGLSLMLKDVNQAVAFGMEAGAPTPVASQVRSLLQVGLNTLGDAAKLEEMVGVVESMAAARLRDETARSQAEVPAYQAAPAARPDTPVVGFVGLGAMGSALARRLMQSLRLHVHDVRPEILATFESEGAVPHRDPASLARACDVVLTCLPDSEALYQVLSGSQGLLAGLMPGKLVIDQSSGDPIRTREVAQILKAVGVGLVDAPVTGVPENVLAGSITVLVSGDQGDCAAAEPVLRRISPNLIHCGPTGHAQVAKLVNNTVAAICRAASYEMLLAGLKSGLQLDAMAKILARSSGRSAGLDKILSVLTGEGAQSDFQLSLMVKDLRLAYRLSIVHGVPMTLAGTARSLFEAGANHCGPGASIEDMLAFCQDGAGVQALAAQVD